MRASKVKRLFLGLSICLASLPAVAAGPYVFYSVVPCRLVDTRRPNGPTGGPALTSGVTRSFPIKGFCGIPATAQQVAVNITMIGATQNGFLVVWPYKTPMPWTSNLNSQAGTWAIANGALVSLAADPKLSISVLYSTSAVGKTDVVLDVTGYLQ
jgi:hypothetical protein